MIPQTSGFIGTIKMARTLKGDVSSHCPPPLGQKRALSKKSDDYNSWQESWWGRRLRRRLDKDTILAEGKLPRLLTSPVLNSLPNPCSTDLTPLLQATKNTTPTAGP